MSSLKRATPCLDLLREIVDDAREHVETIVQARTLYQQAQKVETEDEARAILETLIARNASCTRTLSDKARDHYQRGVRLLKRGQSGKKKGTPDV